MDRDDLVAELDRLSEEERLGLLDREMGWGHPGRVAQRWIAGVLFVTGSVWAVILVLSVFLLVGIAVNVVFMFGWLVYGGWFYVMMGKKMSVSLRFFWIASIVVHAVYGWLFANSLLPVSQRSDGIDAFLMNGLAWWIPLGLSVIALGFEIWVLRAGSPAIEADFE